jgi:hypothetical protein
MLKRVLLFVMLSITSIVSTGWPSPSCADNLDHKREATALARSLFDEVVTWLCANFDLSITSDRPSIEFASKDKLLRMRIADRAEWQGYTQEAIDPRTERNVVAVYDTISRTIFFAG